MTSHYLSSSGQRSKASEKKAAKHKLSTVRAKESTNWDQGRPMIPFQSTNLVEQVPTQSLNFPNASVTFLYFFILMIDVDTDI